MPVTNPAPHQCRHDRTLSVISAGLEHVICDQCGLTTRRYESFIDGEVDRSKFARRADKLIATG